MVFLSTLSLRRATNCTSIGRPKRLYFYPRSPCGERRLEFCDTAPHIYFYPRSPCGERQFQKLHQVRHMRFLSTLSLRRATTPARMSSRLEEISIHALLAESDLNSSWISSIKKNFYPRSPCGERRKPKALKSRRCVFLSTLSLRRATTRQS